MAYDVNIDYTAKNAELQKALAAATDEATKAAIQAQIAANQSSKEEKVASDLTKWGKFASASELDSAAGIMATNQLGTGYEIQKTNLHTSFDNAKQNANNDALSRGMARSSFVSDRMANLDTSRANALTQVDASKALALQNAKTSIIDNYRTNTANALANEKTEFANTIGAYSQDYQQEINNVQGNNDPSDDWKIPYLQQARNEKIAAQEAAALKAAQAASSGSYRGGSSGSSGVGGATMKLSELKSVLSVMSANNPDGMEAFIAQNAGQYGDTLRAMYGLTAPPPPTTRTADYGSKTVADVNSTLNAGYTKQQVIDAAKAQYGVNSKEYNEIVSAVIRNGGR